MSIIEKGINAMEMIRAGTEARRGMIIEPVALCVQRAIYDAISGSQKMGLTAPDLRDEAFAHWAATFIASQVLQSRDEVGMFKMLASVGGPASAEEVRGMIAAVLDQAGAGS